MVNRRAGPSETSTESGGAAAGAQVATQADARMEALIMAMVRTVVPRKLQSTLCSGAEGQTVPSRASEADGDTILEKY